MGLHLHLPPSMLCLFFVITNIFWLVHVPIPVSAIDEQYQNCSAPFRCANMENIGYPFWGGNRSEYCGFPGFELNCQGDAPEIKIADLNYKVLNISNVSRAITVAREDYWDNTCPSGFVNTTLNPTLFNYTTGTENLTLYYSCPAGNFMNDLLGKLNPYQFNCSSGQTNTPANYFFSWDVKNNNLDDSFVEAMRAYLGSCDKIVEIPLQQPTLESVVSNPNGSNLTGALQKGFGLQWFANNSLCDECERSKGQCGYSGRTGKFNCYCPDRAYDETCPSGSGNKKISTGAGIGIAVGAAGTAILGLIFFCVIRRRRKTEAYIKSKNLETPPSSGTTITTSTTKAANSSQSIPSYPYSRTDIENGSTYFGAQVFSCSELEEATDNFNSSKQLGDGGFGAVFLGILRDGRVVAVKRLYENNFKRMEQFMNEVEILTKMQHKNLVKLYGCTSRKSRELLLVYEYIPNGTVADHLHDRKPNSCLLPWPVRLTIAIETADALAYLHASDVIHRDVKTNNILLENNFCVKVADFGLSRLFPNDATHVSTAPQGTPGYVDPEYFQCYKLTDKSDVYSFGVVLIELISGLQAVDTNRQRYDVNLANMAVNKIQNHALNELVDPSLGFEEDYAVRNMVTSVAELAFRCLQQDREMRPTMKEALEILREIKDSHLGTQKAEVVDIHIADDAVPLKNDLPPVSPDDSGTGTDKWVSSSNPSSSF